VAQERSAALADELETPFESVLSEGHSLATKTLESLINSHVLDALTSESSLRAFSGFMQLLGVCIQALGDSVGSALALVEASASKTGRFTGLWELEHMVSDFAK
jgi:hypothetical protein